MPSRATGLILSIGHNPGTNHPRMMGTLHEAARRGVPIIVFNPLRERALERFADPQDVVEMATGGSTRIASAYHQVKAGGDAAALKGIMKALLALDAVQLGAIDRGFIAEHTQGCEMLTSDLKATSWAEIEQESGLAQADLEQVAAAYAKSDATIVAYGMGVTQHHTGTANVRLIADLLLRGNVGKPGAGICPLRGHSNVQGNRTVGITGKPSADFLARLQQVFGFTPPQAHGQYNTTIYGMDDRYRGVFGRRDVLFMNPADLVARGLAHGDRVDIETVLPPRALRLEGITAIEYDIARSTAAAYYPEANVLLPFGLVDATEFFTLLLCVFLSYTLIALEAVANEVAEPFGLAPNALALDAMGRGIERSVLELCGCDLPPPLRPTASYRLT
jgi:anaerobic selenocysteine-containing dehydrogenase